MPTPRSLASATLTQISIHAYMQGHALASVDLADFYRHGKGVAVDSARARQFYERGMTHRHLYEPNSPWWMYHCHNFAALLSNPMDGPTDFVRARGLYEAAAATGYVSLIDLNPTYLRSRYSKPSQSTLAKSFIYPRLPTYPHLSIAERILWPWAAILPRSRGYSRSAKSPSIS